MLVIKLKDNDYQGISYRIFRNKEGLSFSELDEDEKKHIRNALDSFNNISINELEERGAIIFPSKPVEKDLNDKDKIVFYVQGLESDKPNIKTSNIMGFFSYKNVVQFEITSRFDKDERQFFLHYMLQKVCGVAPTVELAQAGKNPFYEFFVYLFPTFLNRAIVQGLFRTYVKREYNDSNIRGVIDFPRHFRYNIPFNGKVAYRTREYSQDNYVTQLIRHTIEYIAENQNLKSILSCDEDMRDAVKAIRGCTGTYTRNSRFFIVNKNMKMLSHPYYTDYEPLRKLCIMILTHNKMSYSSSSEKLINGIFFDGASLWEEYLYKVLEGCKDWQGVTVEHPNNRVKTGRYYLFEPHKELIFPDFIIKSISDKNKLIIADAKYKHLEGANIPREDCFQVLSYMFRFKSEHGLLLYPYSEDDPEPYKSFYLAEHNKKIDLSAWGFKIPQYNNNTEYPNYKKSMKEAEDIFIDKIKGIITHKS